MKKIFLIEDDAVVVEIYRKKFLREGYLVEVAEDGLAAMKELSLVKPDLVVLDLMMPKFNGAEVLKFIRSNPALQHTKVVIFSNAYMTEIALQAAQAGADASLLKSSCTPQVLLKIVKELLQGGDTGFLQKHSLAGATAAANPTPPITFQPASGSVDLKAAPTPKKTFQPTADPIDLTAARPVNVPWLADVSNPAIEIRARQHFLQNGATTLAAVRDTFKAFAHLNQQQSGQLRLADIHRQVHFLTDMADPARCHRIAHLAGALESLLFELQENPKNINASTINTVENAIRLLEDLFARVQNIDEEPTKSTLALAVLVVGDDPLAGRTMSHALRRANIIPTCIDNPLTALKLIEEINYNLLLLDFSLPDMNTVELYHKIRALPEYQKTPVIFVTSATDFKERAPEVLEHDSEVILKPILPIELAVKSLTLLIRIHLSGKK